MNFEFVIVHTPEEEDPILGIIQERLRDALESNLNDVEDDALMAMVQIQFERPLLTDDGSRGILGFSVNLPNETDSLRETVDEFTGSLMAEPIEHAVKCEDPLLREELVIRANELFEVEMKLRRVLSIIYLHAYPESDPYDLLSEETAQPMASAKPKKEQMKAVAENQFFHLTFGQYVGLNKRPAIKDLVSVIRNESIYEAFRAEILRQPVEHEDDAGFLAGLKERMDSIEKMRNAVAHNRRPTKKTTENYLNALPQVTQALDDYLGALEADWQDSLNTETVEDYRGKAVIAYALENAEWDETERVIQIHTEDGHDFTVSSREELETELQRLCSDEWHNNAMKIDGEFVGICDEDSWVSEALDDLEERLDAFFVEASEEE